MYKSKLTCTFLQVLAMFVVFLSGTAVAQEAQQVQLDVQFVELARTGLETGFGRDFHLREPGESLDYDQPDRGYFPIELDARSNGETEHVWRQPTTTRQTGDTPPRTRPVETRQGTKVAPPISNYQLDIPGLPVENVMSVEVPGFPRFEGRLRLRQDEIPAG